MRDPHSVSYLARAAANRFGAPISEISTLKSDKALTNKGKRFGGNSNGSDETNSASLANVRGSNVVFLFGSIDNDSMLDKGSGDN